MLTLLIKLLLRFTGFVISGNYVYHKLLHLKQNTKRCIPAQIVVIEIMLVLAILFPANLQYFIYPLLLLLSFIYLTYITQLNTEVVFTTIIFAYGISFGFYCVVNIILLPTIAILVHIIFNIYVTFNILMQVLISSAQILLCILLFRIKRLKNGMPFLQNTLFSNIGLFAGSLIIFCYMILSTLNLKSTNNAAKFYLLLIPFIFVFFIFLFIWWKNQIQKTYLLKLKEREFSRLEQQLLACQEQLSALKSENQELSKLIHRDNKLIPSMQLAVHEFIKTAEQEKNLTLLQQKSTALLTQLEHEMAERNNIVTYLSISGKQLPSTNVPAIDQLLNYILRRSMAEGIDFDLSLTGNVKYMTKEVIAEADCLTLLADLLENAMIATKANHGKNILLHIGIINDYYVIDVWDSGIPFSKEVLYYLGKKPYTTHKNEGGNGIGMMSTYELAQKYSASFIINETDTKTHLYTKKVSILFNQKQQYCLSANREASEIHYLSQRKDLIIIPRQE